LPPGPGAVLGFGRSLGRALPGAARAAPLDARRLSDSAFAGERARALFAGHAGHSMLPLEQRPSAGFGLTLLTLAHAVGWPSPRGGSQRIADALAADLRALGGTIETGVL